MEAFYWITIIAMFIVIVLQSGVNSGLSHKLKAQDKFIEELRKGLEKLDKEKSK